MPDGANQEGFQEEVVVSSDQGFQEEVAMRVIVCLKAEMGQRSPTPPAGESPLLSA